jgi:flagellar basal body-associated protein FliL
MADNEKKEEKEAPEKQAGGKTGLITWIIIAVTVSLLSGSGFFLGRLLAGSGSPNKPTQKEAQKPDEEPTEGADNWFFDLDPVVANLNVPGATRYVRASITMEMSGALKESDSESLFKAKVPILRNWLAVYLASLTLEDARGDRNLKRIQLEILDSFNEILFPDSKPQIKQILFKEGFAIQ